MINLTPFQNEIDSLEPGQTVRVNHTLCDAGEDTRRRLYITRTQADATKVVGYCHNCQQGGVSRDSVYEHYRETKHQAAPSIQQVSDDVVMPPNLVFDILSWPAPAQEWAYRNRLTTKITTKYSIGHDPSTNRVFLPRWHVTTPLPAPCYLMGYQLRNVEANKQPKYLTCVKNGARGWTTMYSGAMGTDSVCVLVEDLISGITIVEACANDRDVAVIVNYGTKIDLEALHEMSKHSRSIVWLDNDSEHVKEQAKIMARTTKLLGGDCMPWLVGEDPKRHTETYIKEVLYG